MRHRRIIFLDIDGVLNNPESIRQHDNPISFSPDCVERLRRIVERHGALIVVSSAWRFFPNWLKIIRKCFRNCGWVNPPIVGRTPVSSNGQRGRDIQMWLNANPTDSFIILDDVNDFLKEQMPFFVRCDGKRGLTDREVEAVSLIWK